MIRLTRRYRFAAAHVLHRHDLSADQNFSVYGKCANPNGHGHNYGLEITVGGKVDPESGTLVSIAALDECVQKHVMDRFAQCNLNEDALFATLVPTAENIARAVQDLLTDSVACEAGATLVAVRVVETARNYAEVEALASECVNR